MITFISVRFNSWRWIKAVSRAQSTKPIQAQRMYPQEFSFENYECIGFDLDHTICRYKLQNLFTLIYKSLASYLIETYDYPKELAEVSESDFSFAQKGIILDKRRGNFLKLDCQYRIVQATHGTRLLAQEEIYAIYGPNRIWEETKGIPHKLVMLNALNEPFYVFKDYFVTPGAAICAKLVDFLDQNHGRCLSEYNFWDQYIEGILYLYERENFKENKGNYFPELKTHPELYFRPCSENVKNWLSNLRQNKVTILLTSANYDAAQFAAEYCLGKDWKKYFHIIITFARKPGFFWRDKPFCIVSNEDEIEGVKPEDMKSGLIYTQGNFKKLLEVCVKLSKSENPRVAYIGDSLMEDVYAPSELTDNCDTIAIVDEMLAEEMGNASALHDERQFLFSNFWGSFFSYKTKNGNNNGNHSLWTHLLSQHSKLTIPSLDSVAKFQISDKIPCFGVKNSSFSGFFPGIPESLCSGSIEKENNSQLGESSTRERKISLHSGLPGII
ncbi:5'-nucleotidase domain-containing protein 1 [Parasteatoda tepidariorum]|uniref:5'-nucleotidase domain-containing protein 1 n=1 Tax=Parasteatoda tepidariorum TaxID=114398 RepID=UPI001C71C128|nr:5'-nucleotidase domain-containing protein 1 isoform X1 [Parasteatoda tepidariorum]